MEKTKVESQQRFLVTKEAIENVRRIVDETETLNTNLQSIFEALGVVSVEEALDRIAWLNEEIARLGS